MDVYTQKKSVSKFDHPVGPTKTLPQTVIDIFLCFFTTDILQSTIDQTNLSASTFMGEVDYIVNIE